MLEADLKQKHLLNQNGSDLQPKKRKYWKD